MIRLMETPALNLDLLVEQTEDGFFGRIMDRLSVRTDLNAPDNVSDSEKAALQKLLQALKG